MKESTKTALKKAAIDAVPVLIVSGVAITVAAVQYNKYLTKQHNAYTAYLENKNNIHAASWSVVIDDIIKQTAK